MQHEDPVREIQMFLADNSPENTEIPDSVGNAEAVHAIQKQYDEAGLACSEEQAAEIVREGRAS